MAESDAAVSLGIARYTLASQYEVKVKGIMVSPILVIQSGVGSTDCSGCRFFRRGRHIFAQRHQEPKDGGTGKFVSLPLRVAVLPTTQAAMTALARIDRARRNHISIVNLMDLENDPVNEDAL